MYTCISYMYIYLHTYSKKMYISIQIYTFMNEQGRTREKKCGKTRETKRERKRKRKSQRAR